jgi:dihydroorotase
VDLVAKAKRRGLNITAETCPHYFSLSEEDVLDFDTNKKMNPPLRSKNDLKSIKEALKKDIIDVISSDHAPHTENEKDIEFDRAAFGVVGLETELAASISELVCTKILDWPELVKKLSLTPAKILGLEKGNLSKGSTADLIMVSPNEEWVVEKKELISKSKNSCFLGRKLKGRVDFTICSGNIVYCRIQSES